LAAGGGPRRERAVGREHDDEAPGRRDGVRAPRQHRLQEGEGDGGAARAAQEGSSREAFHGWDSGGRLRKAAMRTVWRTIVLKSPWGPVSAAAIAEIVHRSPSVCSLRPKA